MNLLHHNKMNLLFWFSKSKNDGYGTIKLAVTIDGVESQISTKLKVKRKEWRGNLERFSDKQKNKVLSELELGIQRLRDFMSVAGIEVTAQNLTNTYKELQKKNLPPTSENIKLVNEPAFHNRTVMDLIDKLIEIMRTEVSAETLDTYKYKKERLLKYLVHIGKPNYLAKDFDEAELYLYIDWLFSEGLSKNHINRVVNVVKKAFKEALKRKLIKVNPLTEVIVSKEKKRDLRHLEIDELERLERIDIREYINVEYDNLEGLEIARDLFVFMCYTGFHSVDRLNLKDEHLTCINGHYWIISERQKTGQKFYVKIYPNALSTQPTSWKPNGGKYDDIFKHY